MDSTFKTQGAAGTTMGRHRDTGASTRPVLPTSEGQARSHRRPPRVARARAVSLVAVGALAGGIAVASTTVPWSREASHPQPEARPGGTRGGPGTGPGVLPVPPTPPPASEEPVESVAVPTLAPALAPGVPTEPPALPPALVEAPPAAVWRADAPGAFLGTSWNTVGALPPQVNGEEVSFQLTGRGQRSELEPALPAVHEGDQHDVTFSVRLDGEFARGAAARQVIARWENDSPGQAPLDLRVNDGELVLHGGEGHPSGPRTFTRTLGPAPVGEWTQLRVLVRFSADPAKAGVSVWRDGRSVVDDDHPRGGTLYPGQQSYLKVGLHRDRTIAPPSTVRFSAWRIDHGRAPADSGRVGPSQDDTRTAVRRSTGPSDGEPRSTPSGASDRQASETSARVRSDRDVAPPRRTKQRDTSPNDGSDREEPDDGSTSERSSTGSSDTDDRTSQSDTSHRPASERSSQEGTDRDVARHTRTSHPALSSDGGSRREDPEDTSTSEHRSEPSRRNSQHDTSPRGGSEDTSSHQDSSRDGVSADTDAGGGDDSSVRSSDG
jgi:Polysaccharide lyase